ncbi:unnamed protein product [Tilletia caries]|nr:unnamed protein product [Tilletia caries]
MTQSTAARNARNRARKKAKRAMETTSVEDRAESQGQPSLQQDDPSAEQGKEQGVPVPQEETVLDSPADAKDDSQLRDETEPIEQDVPPSTSTDKTSSAPPTRAVASESKILPLPTKAKAARLVGKRRVGAPRPRPRHPEEEDVESAPLTTQHSQEAGRVAEAAGGPQGSTSEQRKRWKRENATMGADVAVGPPTPPSFGPAHDRTPFQAQGMPGVRVFEPRHPSAAEQQQQQQQGQRQQYFPQQTMQDGSRTAQQALEELASLNAEARGFASHHAAQQGEGGGGPGVEVRRGPGYTIFQDSSFDRLRGILDRIDNNASLTGGHRFQDVTAEHEEVEHDEIENEEVDPDLDLDTRDWVDEEEDEGGDEDELGGEYDEEASLLSLSAQMNTIRAQLAQRGRTMGERKIRAQATAQRGRSPTVRPTHRQGLEEHEIRSGQSQGQGRFEGMLPSFLKTARESEAYARGADLLERHMQQVRISPAAGEASSQPRGSSTQPLEQAQGRVERESGSVREQKRRRQDSTEEEEDVGEVHGTGSQSQHQRQRQQGGAGFQRHGFIPASQLTRQQAAIEGEYAHLRAQQQALQTARVMAAQGAFPSQQQLEQEQQAGRRSESSPGDTGQMAQLDIADAVAQAMAQSSAQVWAEHERAQGRAAHAYDDDDYNDDEDDPDDDGGNELMGSSVLSGTETREDDDEENRELYDDGDGVNSETASAPEILDWSTNPVPVDECMLAARRDEEIFARYRRRSESDAGRVAMYDGQAASVAAAAGSSGEYHHHIHQQGQGQGTVYSPGAFAGHACPVLRESGATTATYLPQPTPTPGQPSSSITPEAGVFCMPFSRIPLPHAEDVQRAMDEGRLVPVGFALDARGERHQIVAWRPTVEELVRVHGEGMAERVREEMEGMGRERERLGQQEGRERVQVQGQQQHGFGFGMVSAAVEGPSGGHGVTAASAAASEQRLHDADIGRQGAPERPATTKDSSKEINRSTTQPGTSPRCVNCAGRHEHDQSKLLHPATQRVFALAPRYPQLKVRTTSTAMTNAHESVITAFSNFAPDKQEQSLPGLDKDLKPGAAHFQVEKWDENGKPFLEEYKGNNRLFVERDNKPKTAIITGGDSGIGRAVAIAFAREGACVTIAHLPEEKEDAEKTAELIKSSPMGSKEVQTIAGDLMDVAHVQDLVKRHIERYGGRLDILVNNASKQIPCADFAEIDLNNVESTFRSNILAMHALTKYALPHMKRGASIIQTSSVTAYKGSKGMVDYSSTKAAIIGFTRSLALQLAPKGIRVNAVAMGPVYTPLQPASRSADNMEDWGVGELPLHGRPGQPAELAGAYVFLADSGTSNLMTGQVIHMNSGQWVGS